MIDERPDALLKSALEKIVYFEARSDQLNNDLERARADTDRLRVELASAGQREIELRRLVAELEVRVSRAHHEREETARVSDALRRERAELVGKMLDASRIHGNGEMPADTIDLASFIADLRSEVLHLPLRPGEVARLSAPAAVVAPVVVPPAPPVQSGITRMANELRAQGRLDVSRAQLSDLSNGRPFAGHTEETLFGFSVRELSAPDPSARVRAAERLKALGHSAAAPAIAAALHAETDEKVLVALLSTFATYAHAEGVPVVAPLLSAHSPEVRIAALKALLVLDPAGSGPHLSAAVKDPDRAVRRRASLLALTLTGTEALRLGEESIRDVDPEVRSLAALVLGASGSAEAARPMLITAMRDPEVKVRTAAAQSLSRLLGQDITSMVSLDDAVRRREVRKLATATSHPVMAMATQKMVSRVAVVERVVRAAVAPVALEDDLLRDNVMFELRSAIRGRQLNEVAVALGVPVEHAQRVCASLESQRQVVRRGGKYFVA